MVACDLYMHSGLPLSSFSKLLLCSVARLQQLSFTDLAELGTCVEGSVVKLSLPRLLSRVLTVTRLLAGKN